jgi:predicted RNA-binding Zn-ribbon protein involved in translation (DUF1610 family)
MAVVDFESAWKVYRSRNRLAIGLLVLGFPCAIAIASGVTLLAGSFNAPAFVVWIALWCTTWGIAAFRVSRWPCPRCGRPWLAGQEPRIGGRRACASCGLGLYEDDNAPVGGDRVGAN